MQHTPFPDGTEFGEVPYNFDPAQFHKTLYQALCEAAKAHGMGKLALEDTSGNAKTDKMTYKTLLTFANILAAKLAGETKVGEHVGVLMPNVNAAVALFSGLTRTGRIPAMHVVSMITS